MDGRSIAFFRKHHPQSDGFEVYGFECLPENVTRLKYAIIQGEIAPFTLIPAAAGVGDGWAKFYPGKADGSSLIASKRTGGINPSKFITVPCVDFAGFLIENFTEDDYLIVKMNVEGAEYAIIESLYKHGLIHWIDKWYICWHWNKIGMSKAEHKRIEAMIPKWYPWMPEGYKAPADVEGFLASLKNS